MKHSVFLKPHVTWLLIILNIARRLIGSGERLLLTAADTALLPEEAVPELISVLRFSALTVAVK